MFDSSKKDYFKKIATIYPTHFVIADYSMVVVRSFQKTAQGLGNTRFQRSVESGTNSEAYLQLGHIRCKLVLSPFGNSEFHVVFGFGRHFCSAALQKTEFTRKLVLQNSISLSPTSTHFQLLLAISGVVVWIMMHFSF